MASWLVAQARAAMPIAMPVALPSIPLPAALQVPLSMLVLRTTSEMWLLGIAVAQLPLFALLLLMAHVRIRAAMNWDNRFSRPINIAAVLVTEYPHLFLLVKIAIYLATYDVIAQQPGALASMRYGDMASILMFWELCVQVYFSKYVVEEATRNLRRHDSTSPPKLNSLSFWLRLANPFWTARNIICHPNIGYLTDAEIEVVGAANAQRYNVLDVYNHHGYPRNCPILIYFHGGQFRDHATKGLRNPALSYMVQKRWIVVLVEYRSSQVTGWPGPLVDAKRAIRWIRTHIHKFGGDASYIAVAGYSVGATLASLCHLTAADPAYQPGFESVDTRVQSVILMSPVLDFVDARSRHLKFSLDHWFRRHMTPSSRALAPLMARADVTPTPVTESPPPSKMLDTVAAKPATTAAATVASSSETPAETHADRDAQRARAALQHHLTLTATIPDCALPHAASPTQWLARMERERRKGVVLSLAQSTATAHESRTALQATSASTQTPDSGDGVGGRHHDGGGGSDDAAAAVDRDTDETAVAATDPSEASPSAAPRRGVVSAQKLTRSNDHLDLGSLDAPMPPSPDGPISAYPDSAIMSGMADGLRPTRGGGGGGGGGGAALDSVDGSPETLQATTRGASPERAPWRSRSPSPSVSPSAAGDQPEDTRMGTGLSPTGIDGLEAAVTRSSSSLNADVQIQLALSTTFQHALSPPELVSHLVICGRADFLAPLKTTRDFVRSLRDMTKKAAAARDDVPENLAVTVTSIEFPQAHHMFPESGGLRGHYSAYAIERFLITDMMRFRRQRGEVLAAENDAVLLPGEWHRKQE
ncbi:hypothetical protein CXG81DRAFT_25998 [Caulochytrium protostelioides]|uniref:BD-FAE-like domain-containing protein n=1 Tax=Caulochytrium protostelioides TaxID=1555241 RepID=A0A4V1IUQ1_9FUNG|nr:hypothetical protein CXG81DRAFT_25998 [Caulochytrium protostelioides]|eukprot:RKP01339.1 hypothetical protein CXG81DRAFT_25998 [Caulochytrium protostelioides]